MSDIEPLRLSFEFFPPKTEKGREKLANVHKELAVCEPEFFSVTYGAGGSTRDNTIGSVNAIKTAGSQVAPHLSFGGDDEESMIALLNEYKDMGIDRLVALRGDMPSGMGGSYQMVYANQLVEFIRKHTGDHFHLEVAAYPEIHPEAQSFDSDVDFLKQKFDAGANSAITQYFYNPDAYFYFIESCMEAGIDKPIYPGIMPITNYQSLSRFSTNCGAEIPRWMRKRLEAFGDDTDSIKAFGLDIVSELCETLLENDAPGLHFYTMNNAQPTTTLIENLGLIPGKD
ncbi:methylenetetrahydrofolate reductase [NAD(P)H] [Marinagarivorans cellulosilyticus]|uniref:Methylenetetrahydrofolate reductase n=1 Tax=Marinagarivorans cellulosilyticus TaxID=2721545 RepID=A0AAN1WGD8_9GAMM|nr:methylenetetrahydrofolate reductase [NAD(P)H] [Marinagarivorans cellulosilyticus]BCD97107.1 methylenetetrahydrofolate reductase (NADPH) [Marinagarivorans cellulosilyticus]